ncbi:hypothetical protein GCM10017674_55140 [Streptomyces gardneri]|uniref:Transposase IS4-like domain-containing protein n=1 Tax=Streptomyces gardneri TaxID=66892 RepID=A0A4Y3RF33_9ACTN|nr:hypothetical protein SGA01_11130 [Streptomyces gardneri]GHH10565.1 hypothetical protein GCM10017674_55140 [Streptomyces gardneri]
MATRSDVTQLIPLLQAVPPVRGRRGRPRRRPDVVLGDRGYGHDKYVDTSTWERDRIDRRMEVAAAAASVSPPIGGSPGCASSSCGCHMCTLYGTERSRREVRAG